MAKMISKTKTGKNLVCPCCIAPSWRTVIKRSVKRRERQAWKKDLSNI